MRIKERNLSWCLCLLLFLLVLGCDDDKPDKEYKNLGLSTYENDVREITPYTADKESKRSKMPGIEEEECYPYLLDWNAWKPVVDANEHTVLDKLFDPGNGLENIYGPVQEMDWYVDDVNQHAALLDELGKTTEGSGEYISTFSVLSIETKTIEVPFFNDLVSVDRIVEYDDGNGRIVFIAFTKDDQKETLVAFSQSDAGGPLQMVVYGERDNDTSMVIKVAVHLVYDGSRLGESFKGQFIWKGNLDEKWFSIAQKTDAANGNWEVVGGGSIAAGKEMAFMSRNNDGCSGWYYIKSITNDQIIEGAKPGDPIDAETDPPDGSTDALKYITDDYPEFPGELSSYPTSEISCEWCSDQD